MSRKEGGLPRVSLHYLELDYLSCHSSSHPPHGTLWEARRILSARNGSVTHWTGPFFSFIVQKHQRGPSDPTVSSASGRALVITLKVSSLCSQVSPPPLPLYRSVCPSVRLCSFCCWAAQVYHLFFSFLSSISLSSWSFTRSSRLLILNFLLD